jgi:hypothetical protein
VASPAVAATNTTNITSAADPWTVNLPASISAGDLLIVLLRGNNGNAALAGGNPPSGWTALVNGESSDASNDVTHVLYRWADGGEGTTLSVDLSSTAKGAAISYRITGAENPATQAPEVSTVAVDTGANADPGTVTPTGGSKDYLFLVFAGLDGETQTYTEPTSYSNLLQANSGTGGTPDTNVRVGAAERQLTASSEDPGAFTNSAPSTGWTAYTIAIHPAAAAATASLIWQPALPSLFNR